MIANSIKKEIINDWSNDFTALSIYAQNKLYKILGPFILGVEILSLPRSEDYRPIFVCYPLWRLDVKQCLDEPVFMQEIYDRKGFQFDIPYLKHHTFFEEAIECTKKQASILLHDNTPLKQLFEVVDNQFSQTLIRCSPVGQAKLFEGKIYGALYINDTNAMNKILAEVDKASKSWSPELFEWKYGRLDIWLQNLRTIISNRDRFLAQVQINKQDKKIAKLYYSELTT